MKLKGADESGDFKVPPIGRYRAKAIQTEAKTAGSGAPMIAITGEIRGDAAGGEVGAGAQFFDNMITDETFKGSGFGKKKLRGLGVNVDSEVEIADEQIAAFLLDREFLVDLEHEQIMGKDANGAYTIPQFKLDDGKQVPKLKLVAKAYYSLETTAAIAAVNGGQVAGAPAAQAGAPALPPPQAFPGAPAGAPGGAVPPPWAQNSAPAPGVAAQPGGGVAAAPKPSAAKIKK